MSLARQHLQSSGLIQEAGMEAMESLGRRAELVSLEIGKPFQRAGQMAPGVALLLSGRLRRIWNPPGGEVLSLGLVQPGEWIGWASALRQAPDLTVTASAASQLVLIPLEEAVSALRRCPTLLRALEHPMLEELAVVLLPDLLRRGRHISDPRSLLEDLIPHARLVDPTLPLPEGHWLAYSGPPTRGAPDVGGVLQGGNRLVLQPRDGDLPPRIVALPEEDLARALGDLVLPGHAVTDLALRPGEQTTALMAPVSQEESLVPPPPPGGFPGGAASRLEQALTCIVHLAAARRLTFSRDLIRRNLEDVENRLGALKLPQVGLQLEALGFDTQPLRARAWDLNRLEPPALLDLDGAFVLLLVTGGDAGVLIGDPRQGLRRLGNRQLEQLLPDGLDVLVIREGRTEKQLGDSFGLGWVIQGFLKYPGLLSMTLITAFTSQLLMVMYPLGMMLLINQVIRNNNASLLVPMGVALIATAIASNVLGGIRGMLSADLSDRVDVRLGSSVVEHLLRLPLSYFERRQVGNILFNVNQLYSIRQFVVDQVLGTGIDSILAIIFLVLMVILSPLLALITLSIIPILFLLNLFSSPALSKQIKRSKTFGGLASAYLYEVVSGIRTVKSQDFAVEARWNWLERYRRYTASRFRLNQLSSLIRATGSLASDGIRIALMLTAAILTLQDKLSLGAFIAVRMLSGRVIGPLLKVSTLWQDVQEMKTSLQCLSDVMLSIPETSGDDLQLPPMPPIRGSIRMEDICFRYKEDGPLILDHIDLLVESGQFVGIAGMSGSGKSTLVQLIDRLYPPKQGRVYVDGMDIAKVQLPSLRRHIGYVPQDSLLFQGTILENIRLNNPDASIESVIEAARVAVAHDFIQELDNGYATRVGERGAGLSGGQQQRLCLARTILQDPSLLILDEATSALDAETERQVCRNLSRRFADSTVLFITHRLTTLKTVDRIIFMNKGQIVEDGTHADLIARRGSYATLYFQQVGEE